MRPPESFIGQPIRSLQTMLRVLAENNEAYLPVIPDGIYGPQTQRAVLTFQRRHGLGPTGVADQQTWEAILAEYEPARIEQEEAFPLFVTLNPGERIRRGQRHPVVYLAQAILTVLGESYASIGRPGFSGFLDDATAEALAAFQQLSGLPMTGHLDKHTWKHLTLQFPLAAAREEENSVKPCK